MTAVKLTPVVFTTSIESLEALAQLFNSTISPIACEIYGGGHCDNPTRNRAKQNIWGPRGDASKAGKECKLPIFLHTHESSEPAALINIGVPGGTVVDRSNGWNSDVYEIGLFVADRFFVSGLDAIVSQAIHDVITTCNTEEDYTKTIANFVPSHPYLEGFLVDAGAAILTEDNIANLLGANSLHPERFQFDNGIFHECSEWDKTSPQVEHDGWNSSHPCIGWTPKEMVVFEHDVSGHIALGSDEL